MRFSRSLKIVREFGIFIVLPCLCASCSPHLYQRPVMARFNMLAYVMSQGNSFIRNPVNFISVVGTVRNENLLNGCDLPLIFHWLHLSIHLQEFASGNVCADMAHSICIMPLIDQLLQWKGIRKICNVWFNCWQCKWKGIPFSTSGVIIQILIHSWSIRKWPLRPPRHIKCCWLKFREQVSSKLCDIMLYIDSLCCQPIPQKRLEAVMHIQRH